MLTYCTANIATDSRQLRDGLSGSVETIVAALKAGLSVDTDSIAAEIIDSLKGPAFGVVQKEGQHAAHIHPPGRRPFLWGSFILWVIGLIPALAPL